jgi:hypothetical protein
VASSCFASLSERERRQWCTLLGGRLLGMSPCNPKIGRGFRAEKHVGNYREQRGVGDCFRHRVECAQDDVGAGSTQRR